jgi:hypothetical protein
MIGSVASSVGNPWDYRKACYRQLRPMTDGGRHRGSGPLRASDCMWRRSGLWSLA